MSIIIRALRRFLPKELIGWCWHFPQAVAAAVWFGFPARRLTCIAVAGTKGKTTTTILASRMLTAAGHRVACISTAVVRSGGAEEPNRLKMTTPSAWWLQHFLRQAADAGCTHAVLEVSSHALIQHRVFGIPFSIVVLTNLAPDHLEYHRDARDYQESHHTLLRSTELRCLIVNADDANLESFRTTSVPLGTFSLRSDLADRIRGLPHSLLGEFNVANAAAAATVMGVLGVPWTAVAAVLRDLTPIPGRLERIDAGQLFTVIVDYAHSPDSLTRCFDAVAALPHHRTIVVYGACGDRDPAQRPRMGEVLNRRADIVIVTNDDPFTEDPIQIARHLRAGIRTKVEGETLFEILDRRQAIAKAFALAQPDDLVLILGKGAEQWQVFADRRVSWDDRAVARELLVGRPEPQ